MSRDDWVTIAGDKWKALVQIVEETDEKERRYRYHKTPASIFYDLYSRDGFASYVLENGAWVTRNDNNTFHQVVGIAKDGVCIEKTWLSWTDFHSQYKIQPMTKTATEEGE
jgi:hypothetical protein